MKKFTLNLKNTALKLNKLLHATCRLTYSAVQHTGNYVQLSSTTELVAPYLQSVKLLVQCSWQICTILQSQLLLSIKTFVTCHSPSFMVHLATTFYVFDLRRFRLQLLQSVIYIMCVKLTPLLILQGKCFGCT